MDHRNYHKNKAGEHNELIEVWNNTKNYFVKHPRTIEPPIKIDILKTVEIPELSKPLNCIAETFDEDSFNLAIKYVNSGLNPLVLNMASDYRPGGGVRSGKSAQEEELFRRSNAHQTHPESWYPLNVYEVIYSPEVFIIKDSRDNDYDLIDEVKVGMIACAAIRNPKLINNKYKPDDLKLMTSKIESLFKIAIHFGHDSLVLGALGCGAFHNPPEEVVQIFQQMVTKYRNYFKRIGFAVLVVKSSDKDNLTEFSKIK